jgi:hypothetical protein
VNQIINMIMRIVMHKGMNMGTNKGIDHIYSNKDTAPNSPEAKQTQNKMRAQPLKMQKNHAHGPPFGSVLKRAAQGITKSTEQLL